MLNEDSRSWCIVNHQNKMRWEVAKESTNFPPNNRFRFMTASIPQQAFRTDGGGKCRLMLNACICLRSVSCALSSSFGVPARPRLFSFKVPAGDTRHLADDIHRLTVACCSTPCPCLVLVTGNINNQKIKTYRNTMYSSGGTQFYYQRFATPDGGGFGCNSGTAGWFGLVRARQTQGDQYPNGIGAHCDGCGIGGTNYTWSSRNLGEQVPAPRALPPHPLKIDPTQAP